MPFESQKQRGLAYAVKEGKSTKMPKAVAKKMIAHDPGGKLPKKAPKKK